MLHLRSVKSALVIVIVLAGLGSHGAAVIGGGCTDPLPIDPQIVVKAMGWQRYQGAQQFGPVCSAQWETKSGESMSLLIYGPSALQALGLKKSSSKEAAAQYRAESARGVEQVSGAKDVYTVFDSKTQNRRMFLQYRGKVYMLNVTGEKIPVTVLVKALLRS